MRAWVASSWLCSSKTPTAALTMPLVWPWLTCNQGRVQCRSKHVDAARCSTMQQMSATIMGTAGLPMDPHPRDTGRSTFAARMASVLLVSTQDFRWPSHPSHSMKPGFSLGHPLPIRCAFAARAASPLVLRRLLAAFQIIPHPRLSAHALSDSLMTAHGCRDSQRC